MKYQVFFNVNCVYVEDVEANNVDEAVSIATSRVHGDIISGNLDVCETYLTYIEDEDFKDVKYFL